MRAMRAGDSTHGRPADNDMRFCSRPFWSACRSHTRRIYDAGWTPTERIWDNPTCVGRGCRVGGDRPHPPFLKSMMLHNAMGKTPVRLMFTYYAAMLPTSHTVSLACCKGRGALFTEYFGLFPLSSKSVGPAEFVCRSVPSGAVVWSSGCLGRFGFLGLVGCLGLSWLSRPLDFCAKSDECSDNGFGVRDGAFLDLNHTLFSFFLTVPRRLTSV